MTPLLEVKGITKRFPNITANNNVSLFVKSGEILGLVGENGAGKTTLMRIIFGLETPDSGEIRWEGKKVIISSPRVAMKLGIGMVHQHFQLFPSLSVLENVVLGTEPVNRGFIFDRKKALEQVSEISNKFGFNLDLTAKVKCLSIGEQQRVELLKALYRRVRLLILDEPTTVLTPQEVETLFCLLKRLATAGIGIILISHKLKEVLSICSRIIVMRKGEIVATVQANEVDEKELARLMVGSELREVREYRKLNPRLGKPIYLVENLAVNNAAGQLAITNLSFEVYPGEILGVCGVEGNGQQELVEALSGVRKIAYGRVLLEGRDVTGFPPAQLRRSGIAVVPGDRVHEGANLSATVAENIIAIHYRKSPFSIGKILNVRFVNRFSQKLISEYGIEARPYTIARHLSGGNLQRVVIARELSVAPKVLIAVHPTRGLDIKSTLDVHKRLLDLKAQGVAILLISADLDEILTLSDRIFVLFRGRKVAEVQASQTTPEELGLFMLGATDGISCTSQ